MGTGEGGVAEKEAAAVADIVGYADFVVLGRSVRAGAREGARAGRVGHTNVVRVRPFLDKGSVNREGESIEKRHVEKESESNFRGVRPVSSSVGPVRFARIEENARGTRERGVDAKNKRWREHE